MEFTTILFYLFALALVVSGLKVVTARNPVQSALFLVLAFFSAAAVWMLLQAEFLAILLVLVYVGAVMVLFLFVVMMLDIDTAVLRHDFRKFVPTAMIVGAIVVLEMAAVLWHAYGSSEKVLYSVPQTAASVTAASQVMSNTHLIGKVLYTDYIFAFEVAGLVLLVAIIAAIGLTNEHRKDSKRQVINKQLKTRREDRVRLVKVASEVVDSAAGTGGVESAGASTVKSVN
jgi:NADH-quinone oxidoreductase subunit J